jgi:hypothetical protein
MNHINYTSVVSSNTIFMYSSKPTIFPSNLVSVLSYSQISTRHFCCMNLNIAAWLRSMLPKGWPRWCCSFAFKRENNLYYNLNWVIYNQRRKSGFRDTPCGLILIEHQHVVFHSNILMFGDEIIEENAFFRNLHHHTTRNIVIF